MFQKLVPLRRPPSNRLDLQEVLEAEPTPFPTTTGMLISAERAAGPARCPIETDDPGPNTPRHPSATFRIVALNIGRQPVPRIVCERDGLLLCVEWHHAQDGAEDLFAGDSHVRFDVSKYRWPYEVTFTETLRSPESASQQAGPLLQAEGNVALHRVELPF